MAQSLRLRTRQKDAGQPMPASAAPASAQGPVSTVAATQAYGAAHARAMPGRGKSAPKVNPPRSGFLANAPLWGAAVALLAGGVVFGALLGGGQRTSPIASPAIAAARVPVAGTAAPIIPHEPVLQMPLEWRAPEVDRPALAPPPPPGPPLPFERIVEPPPVPVPPLAVVAALAPPPPVQHGGERWRQLAAPIPAGAKPPYVAIVIDDMGLDRRNAARAIRMAGPLTLSFMSYAEDLTAQAAAARQAGHEVMLHLPMEPLNLKGNNPGPQALYVGLGDDEIRRRLTWHLDRFADYAGVNNHMGSRFTADPRGMGIVLAELQRRGLFWLDSLTGPQTAGLPLAAKRGLAATGRDLFLDDERDPGGVAAQLAILEQIARRNGDVIAIGHPHTATLEALERWTTQARQRGFSLVPATAVLQRRLGGGRVEQARG